jgi:hypothetical protein
MSDELLKLLANEIFAMRSEMKDLRLDMKDLRSDMRLEVSRLDERLTSVENGLRKDLVKVENGLRTDLARVENEVLTTRSQMNFRFDTVESRLSNVEKDTTEIKAALQRLESNEPEDVIGMLKQINTKLGPKQ